MQTYSDTLGYSVGKGDLSWEAAHLKLAQRKISEGDLNHSEKKLARRQMNIHLIHIHMNWQLNFSLT